MVKSESHRQIKTVKAVIGLRWPYSGSTGKAGKGTSFQQCSEELNRRHKFAIGVVSSSCVAMRQAQQASTKHGVRQAMHGHTSEAISHTGQDPSITRCEAGKRGGS